jgi:hypothetical protein
MTAITADGRKVVIPFGNLRTTAAKHNLKARLYIFDSGETVEISDATGKQLARITAIHGDAATASEMAGKWLIDNHYVTLADFDGLVTVAGD